MSVKKSKSDQSRVVSEPGSTLSCPPHGRQWETVGCCPLFIGGEQIRRTLLSIWTLVELKSSVLTSGCLFCYCVGTSKLRSTWVTWYTFDIAASFILFCWWTGGGSNTERNQMCQQRQRRRTLVASKIDRNNAESKIYWQWTLQMFNAGGNATCFPWSRLPDKTHM